MSFYFKNKNTDPMKIKKFYYYSPDKLKLVPINNFISKGVLSLLFFAVLVSLVSIFFSINFFGTSSESIVNNQAEIIKMEYEKEIETLEDKYKQLSKKLNNISESSNVIRIAVNLEPVDVNDQHFGIGGSEFTEIINTSSILKNKKLNNIYDYISKIETNLKLEMSNYEEIQEKFSDNLELFKVIPAIRPVNAPIGDRFGLRFHPILKLKRMHNGLDFLANTGETVFAPGDGVITFVGNNGGYGKVIRITHGYGYETIYGHLSKYKVKKGQKVKRGDIIALTGNSGSLSTGPHLHYEVRHNGVCLNPRNFIFEDLKLFENTSRKMLAAK